MPEPSGSMRSQSTTSGSSRWMAARASPIDGRDFDLPSLFLEHDAEEVAQGGFVVDDEKVHWGDSKAQRLTGS